MNEILLEYYAGKNKDLLACEAILRDIISEVKNGQYDFTSSGVTRTNKLNTELEQHLQNVFKVKQLHIYWKQGMVNAFTITPIIFTTMDANKKLKAGLENNLKVHIAIYEDLITQANLNERELLAFILHEIGHNFYCCPIMIVSNILFAILCLPAALLLMLLKGLLKFGDAVGDFLKENIPFLYKLQGMYLSFLGDFNRFLSGYNNIMSIPTHLAMLITNIVSLNTWTSYGGEKGADSMATRYGYGPDLMSGLMKLKELPGSIYSQVMSSTGEVGKLWSNFSLITMDLIQLIMFDDRMEIRNPGGIYGRIKIDQLGKVQPDTRNPVLASELEVLKITENRYSGIPTIRRVMQEYNLRQPEFLDERGSFIVKLYKYEKAEQREKAENTDENGLILFCKTPRTRKEICEYLGLSSITYAIQTHVMPLVETGVIKMSKPDKPQSPKQLFYSE